MYKISGKLVYRYSRATGDKKCPGALIAPGFLIPKWGFCWRRRRDSNSRAAFTTYTLSRGASSAYLSTSPNL